MLLHSGGHVQPSCYYPDPSYLPQHATPPPPHFDIDAFLSAHPVAFQGHNSTSPYSTLQQQTYFYRHHHHYHHHQDGSGDVSQPQNPSCYFACSCGCPWKPVQETFLHKILTGKGYKNDAMCGGPHRHVFVAGPSVDSGHFNVAHGLGADYGMAGSCCYSGRSGMAVPATAFPPSIPGL